MIWLALPAVFAAGVSLGAWCERATKWADEWWQRRLDRRSVAAFRDRTVDG